MENELLYYDDDEKWSHALLLYDAVLKEICTKLEILNNEFKLAINTIQLSILPHA